MPKNIEFFVIILILIVKSSQQSQENVSSSRKDGKSSLVFVFDTTGSMHNDLKQLIEGAEMILKTALEESDVISNFVFVPFNDPVVGPPTVTRDKEVFKAALNVVRVRGGGDCPEKSLSGILMALNVSLPHSFIYVLTDATASDHRLVGDVLNYVQRKQSQVSFVLTGHCNDVNKPHYKVYQRVAAASSGQVFYLNKTSVHNVLEFVRTSIKGRIVNLGSAVNPPGYNFTQSIPVDSSLGEVRVAVSGARPQIRVVTPRGDQLSGPPGLVTTLYLPEIMAVTVLQPEAGNWTVTVGSEDRHSVTVTGLSDLTFRHGFSVHEPAALTDTSLRPLQGAYNYMLLGLTQTDRPVTVHCAELLNLDGRTLFEVPVKVVDEDNKQYLADAFIPPDDLFFIAINGRDEYGQEFRRVGVTAVQAKLPETPYLTSTADTEARVHQRVLLTCRIESLVPVTAAWSKDGRRVAPRVSSLQSTVLQHVIEDLTEESAGSYRCVAENNAGLSNAYTELLLLVDPPQVTVAPENCTLLAGEKLTVSCSAFSETALLNFQLVHNDDVSDIPIETRADGYFTHSTTVPASDVTGGVYTCTAANRGGNATQSTHIKVVTQPRAQILGLHSLTQEMNTDVQLVCNTEHAHTVTWTHRQRAVKEELMSGRNVSVLDIKKLNISDEGVWSCVASRDGYEGGDSISITLTVSPRVSVERLRPPLLVGTSYSVTCDVLAKPTPRLAWYYDNGTLLNTTSVSSEAGFVHKSTLLLKNVTEQSEGNYTCYAENEVGNQRKTLTVVVRKNMTLVQGYTDKSVELYSQVELHCTVDGYPRPLVTWYHNGTRLPSSDNVRMSSDNSTLFILKADFDNFGLYSCVAENLYEKMVINGSLLVDGLESPVLSREPVRVVTRRGKTAIVTCRILQGKPYPNITWVHKTDTSDTFTRVPADVATSDDRLELLIANIDTRHAGLYRCVAENVLGRDVYDIQLVVHYPPQLSDPPSNGTSPLEVRAGETVTFSCRAEGVPPPVVMWTKDNAPLSYTRNVHVREDNDLVVENATAQDAGLYTCAATSPLGSVRKNFTLIVYLPPTITAPTSQQVEVVEGELVELPCPARGVPAPTVAWRQNGQAVNEDRKYIDEDFVLRFVANVTDFGEYTCVAVNRHGNSTLTYDIHVWVPPYIEPQLEEQKQILVGGNVTLQCDATGFPIPSIVWEFKQVQLVENTTDISFNDVGNIFITNASSIHDGEYTCIAENIVGVAKRSIALSVNEPPTILSENYTGPYIATSLDVELTISCRAVGKPKPFVAWSKDGRFIDRDARYETSFDGSLKISSPSEELSGFYTCVAKSAAGVANKTVEVQIYSLPTLMQSDRAHEASVTYLEGTSRTLQCPITSARNYTLKWYKEGRLVSEGGLTFTNVSRRDAATYACSAHNAVGSAHSGVAVTVVWPPRFTHTESEHHAETLRGEDVVLHCEADANPEAKTEWLFKSKLLPGEDRDRLRLLNVQLRHSGVYKCVVSNPYGTITRQFTLDVLEPPFISQFDVLDVQLKAGTDASLDCVARGSPAPTVRWIYNNTNWHVHKQSLRTSNVSLLSVGWFRCEARSAGGAARLLYRVSVVEPAGVRGVLAFDGHRGTTVTGHVEVLKGTRIRLACQASGNPMPHVEWIRNGNTISRNGPDTPYADLVLSDVATTHAGLYSCVASNEGGVDETTVNVEVLEPPRISTSPYDQIETSNTKHLEVLSGRSFRLQCRPHGAPAPLLYWFRDGAPLRLFDETMVTADFGEIIVVNSAVYEQSGNYTCVARNKVGETRFSYLVDVLVPPPQPKESSIQRRVREPNPLRLRCPAEGAPAPTVLWIKHPHTEISAQLSDRITLLDDNATLIINKTESSDSGKYSCVMSNKVGAAEVVFSVRVERAPSIGGATEPNHSSVVTSSLGRSVVFNCVADGDPKPNVTWFKDTQPLSRNLANTQTALDDSLLTIWRVSVRDAAQYVCVVENSAGVDHRRFNLVITVPGEWSPWSHWSLCNVTCGLGHQRRSRSCQYVDDVISVDRNRTVDKIVLDEAACRGATVDRRKCHLPPCEEEESQPRWSGWSRWTQCSSTCGVGTQTRARKCKTNTFKCYGDNIQIRKCPNLPKCFYENKSANEVLTSREETTEPSVLPEATFELEPEVLGNADVEELSMSPEPTPSNVFQVTEPSANGPCAPGFTVNVTTGLCEDIDECLKRNNQCHSTQLCENVAGAYRCSCPTGYMALGAGQRCLDINECSLESSGCEYACVNVAGGYVCACPRHLRIHTDRHHCVDPSQYHSQRMDEEKEYLSLAMDFPDKFKKYTRN